MSVQFPGSIPIELYASFNGPKDYFAPKEIRERMDPLPSMPDYSTFQHLSAVGKRGSELGEFYWPRGISIQEETGHIYVADSYNHRIQISSEAGDHFIQFGQDLLRAPWGILVCGTSIYVTDRNFCAIFQFAITDYRMIKRVGKKGSGDQEFNSPRNLDIFPNQHIYVADEVNDRIQILNSDLVFQGSIKHQTMTCPFDIKSASNQIFVLSCDDHPCLHILTNSGEKIRTIISRGDGLQTGWKGAFFFCLDAYCNIIISDCSAHKIQILSPEGELIQTMGEGRSEAGVFLFPNGIAIHKRRKLVCVSHDIKYSIQTFSF